MNSATTAETSPQNRELVSLVAHREFIAASSSLEAAQRAFAKNQRDFMAVVDAAGRVIGLCARREIAMVLSARFGFALNARDLAADRMQPHPLIVRKDTAVTEVLQATVARPPDAFFEDVVVVDSEAQLVGLIPMRVLVKVQDELLAEKIQVLQRKEEEIRRKNADLENDLRTARELQLAILPRGDLTDFGLHVEFRYLPSGGVSGDSFDLVRLASGQGGAFVCDVMGHGVRAALVTAMVRSLLRNLAPEETDLGRLFGRLNQELTATLRQSSAFVFVTAVLVIYERQTGQLRYVQAGHPTPLIWRAQSGAVEALPIHGELEGPALGLEEDYAFAVGTVPVSPSDRVFLFTDGLTEAGESNDQFGMARLKAALGNPRSPTLGDALDLVLSSASQHAGGDFDDDICLVGLEIH